MPKSVKRALWLLNALSGSLPAGAQESARRPKKPRWRPRRCSLRKPPLAATRRPTRANPCKYRPKSAMPRRGTKEAQLNRQPTEVGGGDRLAPHYPRQTNRQRLSNLRIQETLQIRSFETTPPRFPRIAANSLQERSYPSAPRHDLAIFRRVIWTRWPTRESHRWRCQRSEGREQQRLLDRPIRFLETI